MAVDGGQLTYELNLMKGLRMNRIVSPFTADQDR